jgi:Protein of unknown function (DUF1648).
MSNRPRIQPELTGLDIALEVFSFGILAALLLFLALNWPQLPERVPKNFGFDGRVEAWGPKASLFAMPACLIFLDIVLTAVSRFPWTYNLPVEVTERNAPRVYQVGTRLLRLMKAIISLAFCWIEFTMIRNARGDSSGVGIGVFFAPIFVLVLALVVAWSISAAKKAAAE